MATPFARSVCKILHDFWCRAVILSVSSPNEPKSIVFPPNAIQDLDELRMNDNINGDLGDFLQQNDLLPNLYDPGAIPFSLNKSPGNNWDAVEEFQDSDNNMGIGIDNFVAIDDL
ncbi:hypothetical protein Tco_0114785 [Tanacetum coccineum]